MGSQLALRGGLEGSKEKVTLYMKVGREQASRKRDNGREV